MARRHARAAALGVALVPALTAGLVATVTATAEPGPSTLVHGSVGPVTLPVTGTVAPPSAVIAPRAIATPIPRDRRLPLVYVTGYTWFDNTPRGSAVISHPVLHRTAGGTGTYADPITVAVGHARIGGREVLDVPPGTRLYLPHLRRYAIVEDTCGDGPHPQEGACHNLRAAPRGATLWIDAYVGGGRTDAASAVGACADQVTDGDGTPLRTIVANPRSGYPVSPGLPYAGGRCTPLFR